MTHPKMMTMFNYPTLTPKYRDFLDYPSQVDFMEGTTQAGKTTVGIIKFIEQVIQSPEDSHVLAGLNKGVVEKNIINKTLGIIDIFGDFITYFPNGKGKHSTAHLIIPNPNGKDKVIYVTGYDDKNRWRFLRGGQYGASMVDEINTADIEFVKELIPRSDYVLATLNPDDPEKEIYDNYINKSRPIRKYANEAPDSILDDLTEEYVDGYVHWFFNFNDNPSLSKDRKTKLVNSIPKGTKQYKNLILGERGRSEGLIFPMFNSRSLITKQKIKEMEMVHLNIGIDTSYSSNSEDMTVFSLVGLNIKGQLIVIDERVYNNKDKPEEEQFSPADISERFYKVYNEWMEEWGRLDDIYIDSADQATRKQMQKDARKYHVNNPIRNSMKSKAKVDVRVSHMQNWLSSGEDRDPLYLVNAMNTVHIKELNAYSFDKGKPEDRNDHTVNAVQYAFIPLINKVGIKQKSKKEIEANRRARREFSRMLG